MITNIPRHEHPNPQFMRQNWMNLNGEWQFEMDFNQSGEEKKLYKKDLKDKITVPFCPESDLSSIGYKDFIPAVWYKKVVHLSGQWTKNRVLLHFGAVDYETKVWVNDHYIGTHRGGYSSFHFDISDALTTGDNTIVVYAKDDLRQYNQPGGKQSQKYYSHGCMYTRTTGIWQTVWLESVPHTFISSTKYYTNIEEGVITLTGTVIGDVSNKRLKCQASYKGKPMDSAIVSLDAQTFNTQLKLSEIHLWEVGKGRLYDLELILVENDKNIDVVNSYFGLRSLKLAGQKFLINNQSIFQRLILDQGFYPDGIYTAPTDEALKADIQYSLDMGFNGARLHEKVFEKRFLYHADQMGYLVWGEYPNWGLELSEDALNIALPEWLEVVERDFNHPSIIGWCPLNETSKEQTNSVVESIYSITKMMDTTRPVIDTSGYVHVATDIYDVHNYEQDPTIFKATYDVLKKGEVPNDFNRDPYLPYDCKIPYFVSEYGGIKWHVDSKDKYTYLIEDGTEWGYGNAPKTEEEFIDRYKGLTDALLDNPHMFAFCYTQLCDVEQEVNGLYTYDRRPKFDPETIKTINSRKAAIED
ncbi:glycoside hydrolase family 2 protein [Vallitalea okinawensis]|uniref:glycoside hydrolase family 2 protein n=1 Tax=Vallitalea okinawensis TaxID=2078660 RepID=UPI000CFDFBE7|nr:sugar-binding domain-containing protein [Vallitalea okinawensis]